MADINLDSNGKELPAKTELIALIDADTVVFAAAVSCEYYEDLLARDMYNDEEWALIQSDPGYFEPEHRVYGLNIEDAVAHSMDKINNILVQTGCKDFELHFTAGRESFRYNRVDTEYKANRLVDSQGEKTRSPMGLYGLKQELTRMYKLKATIWNECEADDVVWWKGDKYPEKYLVCAVDKDVLGATKHRAFNYFARHGYTHPKSGNKIQPIEMQFVEAEDPKLFWYKQCLTGDKGDGIIGLHGVGPAKAAKILKGCKTDMERWDAIVAAYEKAGQGMLEALNNMRMVRLDQFNPETMELTLFDPRKL